MCVIRACHAVGERTLVIPHTGSVLIPFMRPEIVIVSFDIFPICVHIFQEIDLSCTFQDTGNILLLTGTVAVYIEFFAIAAVQGYGSVKW